jgi:hypothetical protein
MFSTTSLQLVFSSALPAYWLACRTLLPASRISLSLSLSLSFLVLCCVRCGLRFFTSISAALLPLLLPYITLTDVDAAMAEDAAAGAPSAVPLSEDLASEDYGAAGGDGDDDDASMMGEAEEAEEAAARRLREELKAKRMVRGLLLLLGLLFLQVTLLVPICALCALSGVAAYVSGMPLLQS